MSTDLRFIYIQQTNDLFDQLLLQTKELKSGSEISKKFHFFWEQWQKIHLKIIDELGSEFIQPSEVCDPFRQGCEVFLTKRRRITSAFLQVISPLREPHKNALEKQNTIKEFEFFRSKINSFFQAHDQIFSLILASERDRLSGLLKNALHGRDAVSSYAKVKTAWRL